MSVFFVSLGSIYVAVRNGVDMNEFLASLPYVGDVVGGDPEEGSMAAYLSEYANLAVAYTVNLAISPARHALDVVCVPIIVKMRKKKVQGDDN